MRQIKIDYTPPQNSNLDREQQFNFSQTQPAHKSIFTHISHHNHQDQPQRRTQLLDYGYQPNPQSLMLSQQLQGSAHLVASGQKNKTSHLFVQNSTAKHRCQYSPMGQHHQSPQLLQQSSSTQYLNYRQPITPLKQQHSPMLDDYIGLRKSDHGKKCCLKFESKAKYRTPVNSGPSFCNLKTGRSKNLLGYKLTHSSIGQPVSQMGGHSSQKSKFQRYNDQYNDVKMKVEMELGAYSSQLSTSLDRDRSRPQSALSTSSHHSCVYTGMWKVRRQEVKRNCCIQMLDDLQNGRQITDHDHHPIQQQHQIEQRIKVTRSEQKPKSPEPRRKPVPRPKIDSCQQTSDPKRPFSPSRAVQTEQPKNLHNSRGQQTYMQPADEIGVQTAPAPHMATSTQSTPFVPHSQADQITPREIPKKTTFTQYLKVQVRSFATMANPPTQETECQAVVQASKAQAGTNTTPPRRTVPVLKATQTSSGTLQRDSSTQCELQVAVKDTALIPNAICKHLLKPVLYAPQLPQHQIIYFLQASNKLSFQGKVLNSIQASTALKCQFVNRPPAVSERIATTSKVQIKSGVQVKYFNFGPSHPMLYSGRVSQKVVLKSGYCVLFVNTDGYKASMKGTVPPLALEFTTQKIIYLGPGLNQLSSGLEEAHKKDKELPLEIWINHSCRDQGDWWAYNQEDKLCSGDTNNNKSLHVLESTFQETAVDQDRLSVYSKLSMTGCSYNFGQAASSKDGEDDEEQVVFINRGAFGESVAHEYLVTPLLSQSEVAINADYYNNTAAAVVYSGNVSPRFTPTIHLYMCDKAGLVVQNCCVKDDPDNTYTSQEIKLVGVYNGGAMSGQVENAERGGEQELVWIHYTEVCFGQVLLQQEEEKEKVRQQSLVAFYICQRGVVFQGEIEQNIKKELPTESVIIAPQWFATFGHYSGKVHQEDQQVKQQMCWFQMDIKEEEGCSGDMSSVKDCGVLGDVELWLQQESNKQKFQGRQDSQAVETDLVYFNQDTSSFQERITDLRTAESNICQFNSPSKNSSGLDTSAPICPHKDDLMFIKRDSISRLQSYQGVLSTQIESNLDVTYIEKPSAFNASDYCFSSDAADAATVTVSTSDECYYIAGYCDCFQSQPISCSGTTSPDYATSTHTLTQIYFSLDSTSIHSAQGTQPCPLSLNQNLCYIDKTQLASSCCYQYFNGYSSSLHKTIEISKIDLSQQSSGVEDVVQDELTLVQYGVDHCTCSGDVQEQCYQVNDSQGLYSVISLVKGDTYQGRVLSAIESEYKVIYIANKSFISQQTAGTGSDADLESEIIRELPVELSVNLCSQEEVYQERLDSYLVRTLKIICFLVPNQDSCSGTNDQTSEDSSVYNIAPNAYTFLTSTNCSDQIAPVPVLSQEESQLFIGVLNSQGIVFSGTIEREYTWYGKENVQYTAIETTAFLEYLDLEIREVESAQYSTIANTALLEYLNPLLKESSVWECCIVNKALVEYLVPAPLIEASLKTMYQTPIKADLQQHNVQNVQMVPEVIIHNVSEDDDEGGAGVDADMSLSDEVSRNSALMCETHSNYSVMGKKSTLKLRDLLQTIQTKKDQQDGYTQQVKQPQSALIKKTGKKAIQLRHVHGLKKGTDYDLIEDDTCDVFEITDYGKGNLTYTDFNASLNPRSSAVYSNNVLPKSQQDEENRVALNKQERGDSLDVLSNKDSFFLGTISDDEEKPVSHLGDHLGDHLNNPPQYRNLTDLTKKQQSSWYQDLESKSPKVNESFSAINSFQLNETFAPPQQEFILRKSMVSRQSRDPQKGVVNPQRPSALMPTTLAKLSVVVKDPSSSFVYEGNTSVTAIQKDPVEIPQFDSLLPPNLLTVSLTGDYHPGDASPHMSVPLDNRSDTQLSQQNLSGVSRPASHHSSCSERSYGDEILMPKMTAIERYTVDQGQSLF